MVKLNDCAEGGPSQDEVTACDLQGNLGHFECADAASAESEAVSDRASDEREDEPEQGDMEAEDEELELGSVLSLLQMSCGTRNGDPLESPLRHLEVDSSVCI